MTTGFWFCIILPYDYSYMHSAQKCFTLPSDRFTIFKVKIVCPPERKLVKPTNLLADIHREDKSMCRLLKCSKNQPQLFQMTSIGKSVIVYNVINDFWSALGTMRLCTSGGGSLPLPPFSSESGSRATRRRGDRAAAADWTVGP